MLIKLYNGQHYLSHLLPSMDEISGPNGTLFYNDGHDKVTSTDNKKNTEIERQGLPDYTLNELLPKDDIELDHNFKRDYRAWLERDVYSTEEEEGKDEEEEEVQTEEIKDWHIGTPLPDSSPIPLSAEDVTREINKLYIEELSREFDDEKKKRNTSNLADSSEDKEDEDGWDKPIDYNSQSNNPWRESVPSATSSSSGFDEDFDDDDDEVQISKEKNNPLIGINWDNLTEEELTRRLALVEEKTVQRWLNVDMDDPRYMKVLNTFEDEDGIMPVDDEGWPI
ncbi:MAG: hypothetical protein EXX96DRAFT_166171 [Benjaminiella poitrasii]|nr:MAG: hypothetical protein EXX96DRAFT_166171 [Benjaminiella poitrasii]